MDSKFKLRQFTHLSLRRENRLRITEVSMDLLRNLLRAGNAIRAEVLTGLPPDAWLYHTWVDLGSGCLFVAVQSESFAALEPDDWIPDLSLTFRDLPRPMTAPAAPVPADPPPCPICGSDETRLHRLPELGFLCENCGWCWKPDDV